MNYLAKLEELYQEKADPEKAVLMARYMKDHFEFYGLPSPIRKEVEGEFLSMFGKPEIEQLPVLIKEAYKKPQREFQYFIVGISEGLAKKLPKEFISTARYMIVTKSWWDTVDGIAAYIIGSLVMRYVDLVDVMDEWIIGNNMWLQRTAILHQLRYKEKTDEERLFDYCLKHAAQNEFFIRKAIGWALREYSKTNPEAVKKFVAEAPISNFSKKEAMKWLKRKGNN